MMSLTLNSFSVEVMHPVEMSEYTLKSKLQQVKHFNRMLRFVTFQVHLIVHFLNLYCFNIFLIQLSAFTIHYFIVLQILQRVILGDR